MPFADTVRHYRGFNTMGTSACCPLPSTPFQHHTARPVSLALGLLVRNAAHDGGCCTHRRKFPSTRNLVPPVLRGRLPIRSRAASAINVHCRYCKPQLLRTRSPAKSKCLEGGERHGNMRGNKLPNSPLRHIEGWRHPWRFSPGEIRRSGEAPMVAASRGEKRPRLNAPSECANIR
jgi:hypothetical protein